jgi:Flp pilus assembly protein TadD
MVKLSVGLGALAAAMLAVPASAQTQTEVGYKAGALGVADMMRGDYDAAAASLNSLNGVSAHDPARLINLGTAYANLGRMADAEKAYIAAISAPQVDLTMADGTIRSSRDVAKDGVRRVRARFGAR